MSRPCEQFGAKRAKEIQELIAAATGKPHEEVCDKCPIGALVEGRERPALRIVS